MTRFPILLAALLSPVVSALAQPVQRTALADGVYLFTVPSEIDRWTGSNSVAIVNERDVTIFDTNTRPSSTRLVLAELRKLTHKPVRTLINSHWHMDHWMGNEVYADSFPGLQIVASAITRDFMKRMPAPYFYDQTGIARERARIDSARRAGASPALRELESEFAKDSAFADEIRGAKHTLPTLAYTDSITLWSGDREFRLLSLTGDASGSTVLYLPKERLVIAGDVIVRREDGEGAQPWWTNSYLISPWLASLRRIEALDVVAIVPGQGPVMRDKEFLRNTIAMYDAIIAQVHAALERGVVRIADVQAAVKLDDIRQRFTKGDAKLDADFRRVATALVGKVFQEARDGILGR
jgi:glyoxylase-like metal-dependent hydrolase (beta-lactamase superfamily II)